MASPAKPLGARLSVAPIMTIRKNAVSTTSARKPASSEYPPGECAPYPFEAKPAWTSKPAFPLAIMKSTSAAVIAPRHLRDDVGNEIRGGETLSYNQPQADGGVEMPAGNMSDSIHHGKHSETEGQRNAGESNAQRRETRGDDGRAASAEDEPESSKELREGTFP